MFGKNDVYVVFRVGTKKVKTHHIKKRGGKHASFVARSSHEPERITTSSTALMLGPTTTTHSKSGGISSRRTCWPGQAREPVASSSDSPVNVVASSKGSTLTRPCAKSTSAQDR